MYAVDAFHAIVNPPQAAMLAVSRIADGVVDGARGAGFLQALAHLVEEPLQLLN